MAWPMKWPMLTIVLITRATTRGVAVQYFCAASPGRSNERDSPSVFGGIAATHILSALLRDGAPCAVNLWEEIREEFTMTVKMGFFAETQGRYCLGVPGTMRART